MKRYLLDCLPFLIGATIGCDIYMWVSFPGLWKAIPALMLTSLLIGLAIVYYKSLSTESEP